MHCAIAFQTMLKPGMDILAPLPTAGRVLVRKAVLSMVLATDNALHTGVLAQFKLKLEQDEIDFDSWDDQVLVLEVALHAADVSNPVKRPKTYAMWVKRIIEEFYSQVGRVIGYCVN